MLYLATYKVKSSDNALENWLPLAQDYVRTLGQSELDLRASLLILSSLHYSRFNLIGPLQGAVDEFISLPLPSPHIFRGRSSHRRRALEVTAPLSSPH